MDLKFVFQYIDAKPFRPFDFDLVNGRQIRVDHPENVTPTTPEQAFEGYPAEFLDRRTTASARRARTRRITASRRLEGSAERVFGSLAADTAAEAGSAGADTTARRVATRGSIAGSR